MNICSFFLSSLSAGALLLGAGCSASSSSTTPSSTAGGAGSAGAAGTGAQAGAAGSGAQAGAAGNAAAQGGSGGDAGQGGAGTAGGAGMAGGGMAGGGGAAAGTTVMGTVDATPFNTAAMALWAGAPDSPDTTVIYVFSKPVDCSLLSNTGWDKVITDKTQVLEMKLLGVAPGSFNVVMSPNPAAGDASVNYTLSTTSGTPKEVGGTLGTVTLSALNPAKDATGAFQITFGSTSIQGTFDATFCPGGHEP